MLAVVTLSLAIGANLIVLVLVKSLWLPQPALDAPDRLVVVTTTTANGTTMSDMLRAADIGVIADLPQFSATAAEVAPAGLLHDYRPQLILEAAGPVRTVAVTHGYFGTLGVPLDGRDFTATDNQPGASLTAAIGEGLWRRAFAARSDIVGSTVASSHGPVRIVAVVPAAFHGSRLGDLVELWIPAGQAVHLSALGSAPPPIAAEAVTAASALTPHIVIARLAEGVSVIEAGRAVSAANPAWVARPLTAVHSREGGAGRLLDESALLTALSVGALIVFMTGTVTLVALCVVQVERRRRDLSILLALGAMQRPIMLATVLEVVAVAVAGSAAAAVVASIGLRGLSTLVLPGGLVLAHVDAQLGWWPAMCGMFAASVAMVVGALVPLASTTRQAADGRMSMVEGARGGRSIRVQRWAITLHVAATAVVLVGALALVSTMTLAVGRASGFDFDRTLFVSIQPTVVDFVDSATLDDQEAVLARKRAAYEELMERLRQTPDVVAVSLGNAPIRPERTPAGPAAVEVDGAVRQLDVRFGTGGTGYLQTLGVPVLSGGDLETATGDDVVVTRALAEHLWPDRSALGETMAIDGRTARITGIVADFPLGSLRTPSPFGVLRPLTLEDAAGSTALTLVLRTDGPVDRLRAPVRAAVDDIISSYARVTMASGTSLVQQDLGRERVGSWFFSGFGLVTVVLALVGMFGLVRQLVHARERDIGVRLALGARPWAVMERMLLLGLTPVALGIAAGLLVAVTLVRLLHAYVSPIASIGVDIFLAAAAVILVGTTAAGVAAVARIRHLSPADILRQD